MSPILGTVCRDEGWQCWVRTYSEFRFVKISQMVQQEKKETNLNTV
jgi:hypothetical protein